VQNKKEDFERRGVLVAVVSFAPPDKLVVYQQHRNWPFLILSDPQRAAYARFELGRLSWLRIFGPATISLYTRIMLKGRRFHYYGADDYQQGGGNFILDRQGKVLFAHRSQTPADRPAPDTLIDAIDRQSGA